MVTHIVKNASPAWKTFKAAECSMNYPGAWTSVPSAGDTVAQFRSADTDDQALLTVEAKPLNGMSAEDFHHSNGPDRFNGSSSTKVLDSSGPDAKGSFSYSYVSDVDGAPLWQRQDVVLGAGKAYVITYSGDEAGYKENLYLAEAMINSFATGAE